MVAVIVAVDVRRTTAVNAAARWDVPQTLLFQGLLSIFVISKTIVATEHRRSVRIATEQPRAIDIV
jgi:hypothetical protein